ncbi:MAG TPA: UDP-glucose 4-epimerase GalE [Phnomibacter sp.]|nr:UDP-glucose 4-epimerase GalE [Phnomibacter sp.]
MGSTKILVTGGLGFIGSHTVVELLQEGYDVVIADDLSNSERFILDNIEKITGRKPTFYHLDLTKKKSVQEMFVSEDDISVVIHFAAYKAVGESLQLPIKYYRNNLFSLVNVLEVMQEFSCEHIVFSSSATVYGEPDFLPINESTAFKKALSAYGSTKQIGEEILEKVAAASNISSIALRYFNPVGAHSSALIGELPIGTPNNLMPYVMQVAAGMRESLTVYGNNYDTPDGTCIRDYIHVVDLAKAHVKSCERLLNTYDNPSHEVFNIGTGNGYSVMEIIDAFEKYNEVKVPYTIGNRRGGDATSIFADVSRSEKLLGWKAELGLMEMVTSAWQWQQQLMSEKLGETVK